MGAEGAENENEISRVLWNMRMTVISVHLDK